MGINALGGTALSAVKPLKWQGQRLDHDYNDYGITPSRTVTQSTAYTVQKPGWKPRTLKGVVLVPFALTSFAFAATIELLAQLSQRRGGFSLSASADDISGGITFAYNYLPTFVSVVYGLCWTWIQLDVMRVQPWLELSKPKGALGSSSLLLDYTADFILVVIYKACHRRHWLVLLAGLNSLIIMWAIVPLQSSIFRVDQISLVEPQQMSITARLPQITAQASGLDETVFDEVFGITWLGQVNQPYTTLAFNVLPFEPDEPPATDRLDETWTGQTTQYFTNLTCWPAITTPEAEPFTYTFDNGAGCIAPNMSLAAAIPGAHTIQYIGYWIGEQSVSGTLEGPMCSENSSHQFLLMYADTVNDTSIELLQPTALFCETAYWQRNVSVVLQAASRGILSYTPLSDITPLSEDDFNSTALEYLISTNVPPLQIPRDYPRTTAINQFYEVSSFNLTWPFSPMVAFALGRSGLRPSDFSHPSLMEGAFLTAHQTIFSMAVTALLAKPSSSGTHMGETRFTMIGITVGRNIAIAIEALLASAGLISIAALMLSRRMQSNLGEDPASIRALFNLAGRSRHFLAHLSSCDRSSEQSLSADISRTRFVLTRDHDCPHAVLEILHHASHSHETVAITKAGSETSQYRAVQALPLRPYIGAVFLAAMVAALVILTVLRQQEVQQNGLALPSPWLDVRQLLLHSIPTAFATLLDPCLVLVNRLLCMVQPFNDLRRGHRTASATIDTSYMSFPPQLTIAQAIRSRHYLLFVVCCAALLVNGLAIALGGLFVENPVSIGLETTLQQSQLPSLNVVDLGADENHGIANPIDSHFLIVMSNITKGTPLPPFVAPEFAFLPFSNPCADATGNSCVTAAQTPGFGLNMTCSELSTSNLSTPYLYYSQPAENEFLYVMYEAPNGTNVTCLSPTNFVDRAPGPSAAQEIVSALVPSLIGDTVVNDDGLCERKLLLAWQRASSVGAGYDVSATYLACQATLVSALFNITVDHTNQVLNYVEAGPLPNIEGGELDPAKVSRLLQPDNTVMSEQSVTTGWHNDSITRDWMNHLLKLRLNTTKLLDRTEPAPAPNEVIPAVESLYQTLFAAQLGLNPSAFQSAPARNLSGTMVTTQTRVFMNATSFIASICILSLIILILLWLYCSQSKAFLPRMPSTIASVLAFAAASRAIRRVEAPGDRGEWHHDMKTKVTYSFGSYTGVDGKAHLGIEEDPFVKVGDLQSSSFLSLLSRRKGGTSVDEEG